MEAARLTGCGCGGARRAQLQLPLLQLHRFFSYGYGSTAPATVVNNKHPCIPAHQHTGSILDLNFSIWEDSLPSFQARKESALPDLGGTHDHPLIELIDTDSLEGDTSTEQGKTIHPHESSQKHEADMLRTIISLSPFQDSTRNSLLQSDVPANTWGTLLSTLDVTATAIKHQADKQDIQVDLLTIMAKYIVGIDSKLQALNDLIQRAQKQNYIQQVACDCAISGDNPQTIVPILNDILAEVRAQALSTRKRLWA
ncbi:hypothetical protein NDU88_007222 [Pleurodeles waltl]|uniref:Uncharacterized protein n=1 Tax=Pleurodeles waltl TaxID=8319 RepID=A0AAV7NUC0_PLEWA|nr:hypothetical protein NDU88_007222 [Pleurodeles waltl]